MATTFRVAFEVVAQGSLEAISEVFYDRFEGVLSERSGRVTAAAYIDGETGLHAAHAAIDELEQVGLCVIRTDPDLVDGPEIAERLGVTRQAVQGWATGTRGDGFPHPYGVVGNKRVWTWGQITEWAATIGRLEEPPALPLDDAARVDSFLAARRARVTGRSIDVTSALLGVYVQSGSFKASAGKLLPMHNYRSNPVPAGWTKRP